MTNTSQRDAKSTQDTLEVLRAQCNGQHVPLFRKNGSPAICEECNRSICAKCGLCIEEEK